MKNFFIRGGIAGLVLMLENSFLAHLFSSFLITPLVFMALVAWTLTLGFRKALLVNIPLLFVADVFFDGHLGFFFLIGFLLTAVTSFLSVRISQPFTFLSFCVYSVLIASFATLFVFAEQREVLIGLFSIQVISYKVLSTLLCYGPILWLIVTVEHFLDQSDREAFKKIR
jgi:hypothetical protein